MAQTTKIIKKQQEVAKAAAKAAEIKKQTENLKRQEAQEKEDEKKGKAEGIFHWIRHGKKVPPAPLSLPSFLAPLTCLAASVSAASKPITTLTGTVRAQVYLQPFPSGNGSVAIVWKSVNIPHLPPLPA
eukprot:1718935-Rhodomonas_salina.1